MPDRSKTTVFGNTVRPWEAVLFVVGAALVLFGRWGPLPIPQSFALIAIGGVLAVGTSYRVRSRRDRNHRA